MDTKRCSKCRIVKTSNDFHIRRTSKDGLTSQCKECRKEYSRQRHERNRTQSAASNRRWYAAHRFYATLRYSRKQAAEHGYLPCNANVQTIEAAHTGRCHICGITENENRKRLCMDHCHQSGKFRGWLCHKCNLLVGHAEDSIRRLQLAIAYLDKEGE